VAGGGDLFEPGDQRPPAGGSHTGARSVEESRGLVHAGPDGESQTDGFAGAAAGIVSRHPSDEFQIGPDMAETALLPLAHRPGQQREIIMEERQGSGAHRRLTHFRA